MRWVVIPGAGADGWRARLPRSLRELSTGRARGARCFFACFFSGSVYSPSSLSLFWFSATCFWRASSYGLSLLVTSSGFSATAVVATFGVGNGTSCRSLMIRKLCGEGGVGRGGVGGVGRVGGVGGVGGVGVGWVWGGRGLCWPYSLFHEIRFEIQ